MFVKRIKVIFQSFEHFFPYYACVDTQNYNNCYQKEMKSVYQDLVDAESLIAVKSRSSSLLTLISSFITVPTEKTVPDLFSFFYCQV